MTVTCRTVLQVTKLGTHLLLSPNEITPDDCLRKTFLVYSLMQDWRSFTSPETVRGSALKFSPKAAFLLATPSRLSGLEQLVFKA